MAAVARAGSKEMYSWWWDSHVSPKNSKWLQENLTDMDSNVKQMIKLIEEDADSFARRAEMYYKKRPELVKLVEEFYRAYRALAERYDHATGVIRHAHRTMLEAFPNQIPLLFADDPPSGSTVEANFRTPPPAHDALFATGDFSKDFLKRNGAFTEDVNSTSSGKGLKQLHKFYGSAEAANNSEGCVRKCLDFQDAGEIDQSGHKGESRGNNSRISDSEQMKTTETEVPTLKKALAQLDTEKEAALVQHKQCLEKISVMEEQLKCAKENARMINGRADKAEDEIGSLKQAIKILIEEKEHFGRQYQQCMENVSSLELKLSCAEEEAKGLNSEIEDGTAKLKFVEEKCLLLEKSNQTLHSKMEGVVLQVGAQSQELTEKQKELGRLWTCIQEERMRFVEAETAFQTLQHLHSQSQDELRSLAAELETRSQLLRDMEIQSWGLHEEIQKVKEENKSLNDLNHSSVLTIKDLRGAYQQSQEQNSQLTAEKRYLAEKVLDLEQDSHNIQEEICAMFGDKVSLMIISLILKDVVSEKFEELKNFDIRQESLLHVNGGLIEKLRLSECQLEESRLENVRLKAFVEKLINELSSVKSVNDHYSTCDIENEKYVICQKENELLRAQEMIGVMHSEMKGSFEEQAELVFLYLQASSVHEVLLREKICELAKAYHNIEAGDGVKAAEINNLKKRISELESHNGGFSAQLAAYIPVVISLRNCVRTLEKHTVHRSRLKETENTEIKVSDLASHHCTDDCKQKSECSNITVQCGTLELQDLQSRLKDVEMAVLEMEKFSFQEVSDANIKLEAMMREVEELKSNSKPYATKNKEKAEYKHTYDVKLQEHLPGTTEAGKEVRTKTIMFDQNSDCSSYGKSRRETMETVAQLNEYWDTSNKDVVIDMRVGTAKNATPRSHFHNHEGRNENNPHSSSGLVVDKELSFSGLESKRFSEPNQEGNGRKILERLDSDAQKLTNLQITVQDLRRKVDITEKGKKIIELDYDGVKGKLEQAEDDIKNLVDVNHKLIKNVETSSVPTEVISNVELNGDRTIRRRMISEQAQRASEKIGQLQIELQKIRFLLLKHDEENESRGSSRIGGSRRIGESSRRVLLQDYLYGGPRNSHKKKRAPFCSCVEPLTRGD